MGLISFFNLGNPCFYGHDLHDTEFDTLPSYGFIPQKNPNHLVGVFSLKILGVYPSLASKFSFNASKNCWVVR